MARRRGRPWWVAIVLVLLLALIVDGLLLLLGRTLTPWDRVGRTTGRPA